MSRLDLQSHTHRRLNLLTGEWVLVSPHRTGRPWQGQLETAPADTTLSHDPECYMCPGNRRASGIVNPQYTSAFAFDNDFAAMRPDTVAAALDDDMLVAQGEAGRCRVICFSPRHDLTLARMARPDIRAVVDLWIEEAQNLSRGRGVGYVQIFENRGEMMGASNPHPHGQIWASATLPNEAAKEQRHQQRHFDTHASDLLGDYLVREQTSGERIVCANEHFVALVPFWAVWPFETLVVPRRRVGSLGELEEGERDGLADILKRLTTRYDNLFRAPFPYSMGFHQQPVDGGPHPAWRVHAHFYPPLLRSATIRKFMVGYELLGTPQRDTPPEQAAAQLRELPERHYLE